MHIISFILYFCLFFFGCAQKNIDIKNFFVQEPGSKWFEIKEGGADFAWYNREIYGAIYVDSNCKQKFEDRPLKDSYLSLTQGIAIGVPLQQNKRFIDNREALFTIQNGLIDGIKIRLASVVLSKDECLYDFLYIAPPEDFDKGLKDFLYAVQSFSTSIQDTEGLPKPKRNEPKK